MSAQTNPPQHSHSHSHPPNKPMSSQPSGCLPDCTLENAMKIIVDTYHMYAPREGLDDDLSLRDLTEFLKCQAPTFLEACNRGNPSYLPWLFKQCDVDNNKKLTFEEFIKVFCLLADDAHRISHREDRCGPDRD
ncbi:PREDICTED: protein S100-A8-like [Gekko japonicus]|uniref:Protein S100-A8-like n=1 Tax=Gekko japonicus TaxID=146911 RepID=A0ABM1K7B6_GEKJA|nr:PREDICTED: protein S100-A8-like [Gekko japonicus]